MPAAQFDENGNYVAGTPWSVVEQMRNGDDGSQQQNDSYADDDNGGGFFGALSSFFSGIGMPWAPETAYADGSLDQPEQKQAATMDLNSAMDKYKAENKDVDATSDAVAEGKPEDSDPNAEPAKTDESIDAFYKNFQNYSAANLNNQDWGDFQFNATNDQFKQMINDESMRPFYEGYTADYGDIFNDDQALANLLDWSRGFTVADAFGGNADALSALYGSGDYGNVNSTNNYLANLGYQGVYYDDGKGGKMSPGYDIKNAGADADQLTSLLNYESLANMLQNMNGYGDRITPSTAQNLSSYERLYGPKTAQAGSDFVKGLDYIANTYDDVGSGSTGGSYGDRNNGWQKSYADADPNAWYQYGVPVTNLPDIMSHATSGRIGTRRAQG